ncbi:hypothetical protein Taro_021910, partial [Colocasia esculenta]|nr:hypothetical protein [Colocasia esculenta]
VIGSPESRFSTWFSLPLAPASCSRVPKVSNRYRRVVGGSWDVWRCRIGRGNAVAWCNSRRSSRRVRCEPGEFGGFERVLSALVVGGTDTSRRTGPQLVLFQCLTLESSGPGSLEGLPLVWLEEVLCQTCTTSSSASRVV